MNENFNFLVFKICFSPQVFHISVFKTGEAGHQTSQAISFYWKFDIFPPGKGSLPLSSSIRYAGPRAASPMEHCVHLGHPHLGGLYVKALCDEPSPP